MKKKFGVALTLALALILCLSTTALAWDFEDDCVAGNEDFIAGGGFDDGVMETQSGAQPWPPGKNPNEGYSLYTGDVTGTGNLDSAFILTFTPDGVDLPIIAKYGPYPKEGIDEYWYMGDESPDTWYWALAPRGYNAPPPPYMGSGSPFDRFNGSYMVDMFRPSNAQGYKWVEGCNGKTLAEPVRQVATSSFVTYGLEIPEGTIVEGYYGGRVQQFTLEIVEGKFCFSPPTKFSKAATLYELDGETWTEILRFDQVDAYGNTSLSPEVVAID